MRKTSYFVTFLLVSVTLSLVRPFSFPPSLPITLIIIRISLLSLAPTGMISFFPPCSPFYHCLIKSFDDRLVDPGREFLYSRFIVKYGLMQRCERQVVKVPDGSGDWQYVYTAFKCRDFPKSVSDHCEEENRLFCVGWTSAGYLALLAVGYGISALLALLVGVSTHSRRRRVWKAVAGLVTLNGASSESFCQGRD
jgi:hypothetical protein